MNQVLSSDGKEVYNIWYLPHAIEIVHLFKNLDEKSCIEALTNMLRICSALHDLVHYIFAHIEMGNKHVPLFTGQSTSESSADSGGIEGISKYYRFLYLPRKIRSIILKKIIKNWSFFLFFCQLICSPFSAVQFRMGGVKKRGHFFQVVSPGLAILQSETKS